MNKKNCLHHWAAEKKILMLTNSSNLPSSLKDQMVHPLAVLAREILERDWLEDNKHPRRILGVCGFPDNTVRLFLFILKFIFDGLKFVTPIHFLSYASAS